MSLAGYDWNVTRIELVDQAGDDIIAGFKAPPVGLTIQAAYFISDATFDADGSNHYTVSLTDGGADGTGTTDIAAFGGASVDTVADTQNTLTVSTDSIDGGDWLMVSYDETGTVAPGNIVVCIHWTAGGT